MGTFTSTFTANNGAQSKTLVHEFNVTAAPSGLSIIEQMLIDCTADDVGSATFANAVQVGDTILIAAPQYNATTGNATNVTDAAGTNYVTDLSYMGGNSNKCVALRGVVTTANAANQVDVSLGRSTARARVIAYLLRGGTLTPQTANIITGTASTNTTGDIALGPYSATAPAFVLCMAEAYISSGPLPVVFDASPAFTQDDAAQYMTTRASTVVHLTTDVDVNSTVTVHRPNSSNVSMAIVPYSVS